MSSRLKNVRKVTIIETIQFVLSGEPFIVPEGTVVEVGERPHGCVDLDGGSMAGENPLRAIYKGVRFEIRPEQFTTALFV